MSLAGCEGEGSEMSEAPGARPALDEKLRFLLQRHPRAGWAGRADLGALARFWLQRHQGFRELDAVLRSGCQAALDERHDAAGLRSWLGRQLQLLLWQLEEHHQVEDQHYFPVFRRLEPRLEPGFELLEGDHVALHEALTVIAQCANAVTTAGDGDDAAFRGHLERYLDAHRELGQGLLRHLDDEEDLVIPLLFEHALA